MAELTAETLESALVAGVEHCRQYIYNNQLGQLGDVLQAMALSIGTGRMQESIERQRALTRQRIQDEMARRPVR